MRTDCATNTREEYMNKCGGGAGAIHAEKINKDKPGLTKLYIQKFTSTTLFFACERV